MANIKGTAANNNLVGTTANDVIDGLGGADTMAGGLGNDVYVVDNIGDIVIEAFNAGIDTVQSSISYLLTANVENLTLTGTTAINGTGNTLNNSLTGNSGNNILDGGVGADTMSGGAGNDTYMVDNVLDVVSEATNAGTDSVQSIVNYTLVANIENLTLIGIAAINGTGNALNNILTGNSANNILNGGTGADTMIGGLGDDTYTVDNVGDVITEAVGAGIDNVQANASYVLGLNLENLTLTGVTNINGTGNALDNIITGNNSSNVLDGGLGNDTLNGGAGADTMTGGGGNDTFIVDNIGDTVTEAINGGIDTVQTSIDFTLSANFENLKLTGTAVSGVGNAENNYIIGNALNNILDGDVGNDTLDGAGGSDILLGGQGNDTYIVSDITTSIIEGVGEGADSVLSSVDYVLAANIENLTLTGFDDINGTGNALDNVITGNGGDNIFYKSQGVDTLVGGGGNDTYVITADAYSYSFQIIELDGEGIDTVISELSANISRFLYVENIELIGSGGTAIGNALDNNITGSNGNDSLFGLGGYDVLFGGLGADQFYFTSDTTAFADILDFTSGEDRLWVEWSYAQFVSGAGLTVGTVGLAQILYDTNTGNLYYEDGLNIDSAINFASLVGIPTMNASDISTAY